MSETRSETQCGSALKLRPQFPAEFQTEAGVSSSSRLVAVIQHGGRGASRRTPGQSESRRAGQVHSGHHRETQHAGPALGGEVQTVSRGAGEV